MKISMLGTRGIPANYSGFETAVEAISTRLAARGHQVSVYCRPHMVDFEGEDYRGVRLVHLPTVKNKFLDTIVHTFISTVHMGIFNRPDVAVYFIAGNSPCALLSRLLGIPSLINVDGLDSHRQKWNRLARKYIRLAEWFSPVAANRVISDSRVIKKYYRERYGKDSDFIPYGADVLQEQGTETLEQFGLEAGQYVLFVGRPVPENCAHVLIKAFEKIETDMKLVIVGDAPYAEEYIDELRATKDERVIFTGYLFGEGYRQLSYHCGVFVVPTEVGGTHPVILEAMAAGACLLVNNHPPNLECIGDAGASYDGSRGEEGLREELEKLLDDPDLRRRLKKKAVERVRSEYNWDRVASMYEELCGRYARKGFRKSGKPLGEGGT